jgi:hypothetical protein
MTKKRAAKATPAKRGKQETAGKSLNDWVAQAGIARPTFYCIPLKLRPRAVKIGRRLILLESAEHWLRRMAARGGVELVQPKKSVAA